MFVLLAVAAIPLAWWRADIALAIQEHRAATRIAALGGKMSRESEISKMFGARSRADDGFCVDVSNVALTDADMAILDIVPNVIMLCAENTAIGDPALAHVRGLTNLWAVDLAGIRVTDSGIVAFNALPRLKHLYLGGTSISDDGIASLTELTGLDILSLPYTGITDAGLKHLSNFPRLRLIDLRGTKVTANGIQVLKERQPNLAVDWP
ncbi:MAG: hypothetical protein HYX69_22985 [Planctomycetia bacterium]|nr:hypothetical protein [Planctomycetia bacterium]